MNQPNFQQPWGQQPQAPQQQPQWGAPQQPQAQPQGQFGPPPNLGQAAAGNLFNQFLQEPPRQRANRAKPADGTYVVRFTPGCKFNHSQKDGKPYLLLEYQVIEGSVPQMQGQVFSIPIFWSNRIQLQDLADLAKFTFGANLGQVAQQTNGDPAQMAGFIGQTLVQGLFAGVRVARSQKQIQTVGYENAFANHQWIAITPQPMTLAQLGPAMGPPSAPTQPAWQQPQAQQPQQQAFPQPPGQPAQSFLPQQQPAFQPQQQQQPAFQPRQQQPAFQPQAGGLPQAPLPQAPQQPLPAFYVPGAQPPR